MLDQWLAAWMLGNVHANTAKRSLDGRWEGRFDQVSLGQSMSSVLRVVGLTWLLSIRHLQGNAC